MFEIKKIDSIDTLFLFGEVDLDNSPIAREKMLSVVNDGKPLHIDLEQVSYIDSSGVAVLIEAMQKTKKSGQQFQLINVSDSVMDVLKLAHLDSILPIKNQIDSSPSDDINVNLENNPFGSDVHENPFGDSSDSNDDHLDQKDDEDNLNPPPVTNNPFIG